MRNFKTVACTWLKLCYASKSVTNGRRDKWTNAPAAIRPSTFFKVGDSNRGIQIIVILSLH